MDISIKDFEIKSTVQKTNFFIKKETQQEWDKLKGAKEVRLQKGKGEVLSGFYIYGWEPAIMLKFKYLSKNKLDGKERKEFWDSVIWHGNGELSDTEILDPKKYKFDTPFRIINKKDSERSSSSKLVRKIKYDDKRRQGGRKKKKRRKAFPSRRKNNRKNRTKKKALSK
jgi:hypothetical protein